MPHSVTLTFDDASYLGAFFGEYNSHLQHIEKKLGVSIADRGNILTIAGGDNAVDKAEEILLFLWEKLLKDKDIGIADIDAAIRFRENDNAATDETLKSAGDGMSKDKKSFKDNNNDKKGFSGSGEKTVIRTKKKSIVPRSPNQAKYIETIRKNPMVFGLGPAGTGKTYLAVACGVSMYLEGAVERLIFCRPALEAGERLGFLPGDMKEKVDPYLRPIYDALQDMLPLELVNKKMETGDLEIAPLAFMRGRTLSNAFVILDEAQNTTTTQMKMFLTRMGEASRMVVTGDVSQTDLPRGIKSGLKDAQDALENIDEIKFMKFENKDVVRHPLVGKIIDAYDVHEG